MQAVTKQQGGPGKNSETTLFEQAQEGCRQSLNLLMSRHEGLIHAVIHKQYLYGLPYEEALQAGRSALWRAIMDYERQRGTTFSTYAWAIIMRAVWAEVKRVQDSGACVVLEETWLELLLHLVDFSGLRPVLARQLDWRSTRGQVPFDPVSLFLLLGWQLSNGWNRAKTLRKLVEPRYADLARLFGFRAGQYPTEGGLRYFLTTSLTGFCFEYPGRRSPSLSRTTLA